MLWYGEGCSSPPVRSGGREVRRRAVLDPLAVDVGIGVDALAAGEVLMLAGYKFRWHADQHPLNHAGAAWGIPVKE
jgi:hypothetical protein